MAGAVTWHRGTLCMISKRQLSLIMAGAAVASVAACRRPDSTETISNSKLFEMPSESAPHLRTFMQWPVALSVYGATSLRQVQATIIAIANTIAQFEPLVMLSGDASLSGQRSKLSTNIEVWDIPTDDLWCRDSGPTFVKDQDGNLAIAQIQFNGWGNKQAHANDALIAPRVAQRLGIPFRATGIVGEQGGLEHDGAGLFMAHESSWANPNRSRVSRDDIEAQLKGALGAKKVLWAPGLVGEDITDYHIDALARFVGPSKVLIQIDDQEDLSDPWSRAAHATLAMLQSATDASGKGLTIVKLPEPANIRARGDDFVASYVNFYVCNDAVITAQFGDPRADDQARDTIQELYPEREIVMLDVDPLGAAGGGIHCATQQQPA